VVFLTGILGRVRDSAIKLSASGKARRPPGTSV